MKSIIVGNSKVVCDEIIYVLDIISTNVTNAISAVSTNCHNKKVRCKMNYILLAFLLVMIVLFIITFICHYYTNKSKQKYVNTMPI